MKLRGGAAFDWLRVAYCTVVNPSFVRLLGAVTNSLPEEVVDPL